MPLRRGPRAKVCATPGCPSLTTATHCVTHTRALRTAQDGRRGTRTQRGLDNRWLRLRDRMVRDHVSAHGWVCPGYDRPLHPVEPGELTGDHRIPRSVRPDLALEPSNVDVLCASCNSRKGATTPG